MILTNFKILNKKFLLITAFIFFQLIHNPGWIRRSATDLSAIASGKKQSGKKVFHPERKKTSLSFYFIMEIKKTVKAFPCHKTCDP